MAVRSLEIGALVSLARAQGYFVGMVTLTMRHRQGQALADLWDALGVAWRRVMTGKQWAGRSGLGWAGQLRVVEVTHGQNGWHVHVHSLVFLEPSKRAPEQFEKLALGMFNRWASGLRSQGLEEPLLVGQEWHEVTGMDDLALGQYLAKSVDPGTIGLELMSSQTKGATWSKTVTPWTFLNALRETGESRFLRWWIEYERASHGRRQLTYSRGLRDLFELGQEATDEEIAEEVVGTESDTLAYVTAAGWKSLTIRGRRHLIPELLEVLGRGRWDAVHAFLELHGVEHFRA